MYVFSLSGLDHCTLFIIHSYRAYSLVATKGSIQINSFYRIYIPHVSKRVYST